MRALVTGYGSIGKRHARNLNGLGFEVTVKTDYPDNDKQYTFISDYSDLPHFDLAVISSPTARHLDDVTTCAGQGIKKILMEKPVEIDLDRAIQCRNVCDENDIDCSVAYNLRFHPLIKKLKAIADERFNEIRLVKISAGSYLPSWRPDSDYTGSYSARKAMGGGVHLDLSHEIDYMLWIFGEPREIIQRYADRISTLAIDSFDYFKGVYRYDDFVIDVDLDYFRKSERYVQVIGENREICRVDLVAGTLVVDNEIRHWDEKNTFEWNSMYTDEIRDILLPGSERQSCSLDEAIKIMEMVELK